MKKKDNTDRNQKIAVGAIIASVLILYGIAGSMTLNDEMLQSQSSSNATQPE